VVSFSSKSKVYIKVSAVKKFNDRLRPSYWRTNLLQFWRSSLFNGQAEMSWKKRKHDGKYGLNVSIRWEKQQYQILYHNTRNTFCGTTYVSHCRTTPVTFNPSLLTFCSHCSFPTKPLALMYHHLGHMISVTWPYDSLWFSIYGQFEPTV